MGRKTKDKNQAGGKKNPTLGEFLWGGTPSMRLIKTESPELSTAREIDRPVSPLSLLRYPEGETPLERGPNHVYR
jgi:hypothetical protein